MTSQRTRHLSYSPCRIFLKGQNKAMRSLPLKITLCILAMEVLGGLGAFLTSNSITSWYSTLVRPPGTPPNWLFGPVWTILYAMIGTSFALIWHAPNPRASFQRYATVFTLQLLLNLLWTPVFFGVHQITAALVIIIALLIAIVITIRLSAQHSKSAAYLLIPYLIWVSYATYLNAGYAYLN